MKPVVKDQKEIFKGQAEQNKDQTMMSMKVNESGMQIHRMHEAIGEFK